MIDALALPFFQRVLVAGLLASLACGIIGSYVVAKRISGVTGGLSHAAFGGVGLGYWLGFPPMLGATLFGLVAGAVVVAAQRRLRSGLDTLISMVWSLGMALGILFIAVTPGYAPDLMSYLFGSLLFVSWDYVALVAALDIAIVVSVAAAHRLFQAVSFDEEFAEVRGVRVELVSIALMALVSLAVVTLIRVVGVILAIALITLPAATARQWVDTLLSMMYVASVLCALCVSSGLLLSFVLSQSFDVSLPPGPLVIVLASFVYAASAGLRAWIRRRGGAAETGERDPISTRG